MVFFPCLRAALVGKNSVKDWLAVANVGQSSFIEVANNRLEDASVTIVSPRLLAEIDFDSLIILTRWENR